MKEKKTLVVGASHKPYRYSYLAIKSLKSAGQEVIALGKRARKVEDWEILEGKPELSDIHTITLYLNSLNQIEYYDYFLSLKPERVIFNPGAENPDLEVILQANGVEVQQACTLVMVRTGQF